MNVTEQFNRCELQRVWKTFINGYQHHFIFIPCMMIILEIIYFLLNTIRGRENSEKECQQTKQRHTTKTMATPLGIILDSDTVILFSNNE